MVFVLTAASLNLSVCSRPQDNKMLMLSKTFSSQRYRAGKINVLIDTANIRDAGAMMFNICIVCFLLRNIEKRQPEILNRLFHLLSCIVPLWCLSGSTLHSVDSL